MCWSCWRSWEDDLQTTIGQLEQLAMTDSYCGEQKQFLQLGGVSVLHHPTGQFGASCKLSTQHLPARCQGRLAGQHGQPGGQTLLTGTRLVVLGVL